MSWVLYVTRIVHSTFHMIIYKIYQYNEVGSKLGNILLVRDIFEATPSYRYSHGQPNHIKLESKSQLIS